MIVEEMIAENLLKKTLLAACWSLTHLESQANANSARVNGPTRDRSIQQAVSHRLRETLPAVEKSHPERKITPSS